MKKHIQSGMTLIELTVVLLILIALAGLTVPYMTGISSKALCDATDLSMQNLKKIIMERYYLDTLGHFPASKGGTDYSLNYLMEQGGWDAYDPETAVGWRGPYLSTGVMLTQDASNPNDLDSSFGVALDSSFGGVPSTPGFNSVFDSTNAGIAAGTTFTYVHFNIVGHSQATSVPHTLDAWGRPIILQIPYDIHTSNYQYNYARLVSAGPTLSLAAIDTKIQYDSSGTNTSLRQSPDAGDRNNDRVLYLKMPDPLPGGNQPCDG